MVEGLDMTLDELIHKNKKLKKQDGYSGGSGSFTGRNRQNVCGRDNRAPWTKRFSMDRNVCNKKPYFMQPPPPPPLPPPPPPPPPLEHQVNTVAVRRKLHVSNLHHVVTENDIKVLFSDVGPIEHYRLYYDNSGRSKGTAEVVFKNSFDAAKAFRRYNNLCLDGRRLKIEFGIEIDNTPNPSPLMPFGVVGASSRPIVGENYTAPYATVDAIGCGEWAKFKHAPKGGLLGNLTTATYGSIASLLTDDVNGSQMKDVDSNQRKLSARQKSVSAEALDADLDNFIKRQKKFGI